MRAPGFYLAITHFFFTALAQAMPAAHTSNEIIVKYREASMEDILSNKGSASTPAFILRLSHAKKLKLQKSFPAFNIYAFEVPETQSVEAMVGELKDDPNIEFSEPNFLLKTAHFSLTAFALESVSGDAIGVFELKPEMTQTEPLLIGVVDTGIDTTHPVLQNRIWTNFQEIAGNGIDDDGNGYIDDIHGWNFSSGTNDPFDDHGHGTHVAGTLSGVSSPFTVDTTGNFKLVPLKFLDSEGTGTTLNAISAISYGLQIGVKVFNNSWGGGGFSMALHDVITQTYKKGILMVAAAGNENQDVEESPVYPASFEHPNLISVAAMTSLGSLAWFSNYGKVSVDLGAPGVSVYSTLPLPGGQYGIMSGTSMATAYISRVAMLMMDQNRSLSVFQIKKIMMETVTAASSLADVTVSGGIVNAAQALAISNLAQADGMIPPYTPTFLSLLSPEETQKEVNVGPSGCGWIDTSGPSNWDGTSTISLLLVIFVLALIQLPARLHLNLTSAHCAVL
ncbi:MAG: S8 family serine peptidase [Deltaproteobacteria bacterium]|nr:S8 family serine peptidase [Deltaproteobacteria bacterium]